MKKLCVVVVLISVLMGCASRPAKAPTYTEETESYTFIWDTPDDPYLTRLRAEFNLDDLTADCEDGLETVVAVTDWVHNLWEHDGSNEPERSDPLSILREVEQGERFRCVEYAVVISGCLNALGYPSRTVGLKTRDVETRRSGAGHVVVETYVPELEKWVMADGQWNIVPVAEGIPLNCVELQKAIAEQSEITTLQDKDENPADYLKWIRPYLYYLDSMLDNRVAGRESYEKLMLVPVDAKEPTVFQRRTPIKNMLYTHSISAFYPRPKTQ